MNLFQIPSFVPVPSREVMFKLSIISVIIGICLIIAGLILNNKNKKKGIAPWICITIGIVIIVNHGIQLLFAIF
ncbi:hypothetical protein EXN25_09585 [Clostridium botulinum]|uniref:hypothetical protein n=1 Tax=Clostridium botulinum TaxID=1491 RepID=UPI0003132355|nr:hypothetical protein [Clostridium botulinum]NFB19025.1 hypothetical protein [Clostridium botulinum]NFB69458.1 hypothetical protein [Clostridium botulinum]NFB98159.1 hypothetical protein [Clostridium botulinum]NFC47130.1 hypothetical protein [Clostridium botulinum]NFC60193.1 hypothetical protein [Clostridium botulinum]